MGSSSKDKEKKHSRDHKNESGDSSRRESKHRKDRERDRDEEKSRHHRHHREKQSRSSGSSSSRRKDRSEGGQKIIDDNPSDEEELWVEKAADEVRLRNVRCHRGWKYKLTIAHASNALVELTITAGTTFSRKHSNTRVVEAKVPRSSWAR